MPFKPNQIYFANHALRPFMLAAIHTFFARRSPTQIGAVSCLFVGVIALLDYRTGYQFAFSIFYAIPISVAAWYLNTIAMLLVSTTSSITWLAIDILAGHQFHDPLVQALDFLIHLVFFLIVAIILARIKHQLRVQTEHAHTDSLTGILNSRGFRIRCDALFDLASRLNQPVSLAYIDLDSFKAVNDARGHSAGDEALKAVASVLSERLRASDAVGRLGGDEFALLLFDTGGKAAAATLNAIRERLRERASSEQWPLGFSIGAIVLAPPLPGVDEAIKQADELMYEIKKSCKNSTLIRESDKNRAPSDHKLQAT